MKKYRVVIRDGVYRIIRPNGTVSALRFDLSVSIAYVLLSVRGMIINAQAEREAIARMRAAAFK